MSTFSNPAGTATEDASRYVAALLELLGERDPYGVMEELVPVLRELARGMDGASLRRPEAPGKWSVIQVLGHLMDTELVYRYRMRRVVAEPGGPLASYDQDAWARRLDYERLDVDEAFFLISTLRGANLRWLRGLTDEELDREGVHSERGPESVRRIVRLIAAHDLVHRRQIERIKRAAGAA